MMRSCTPEVYRAAFAFAVMFALGAARVTPKRPSLFCGQTTTHGSSAEVEEWAIGSEVVGRKVTALGECETWLRDDIADLAEAHLEAERQDIERVKAEVMTWARQRETAPADPKPLSAGLLYAAMRHSRTLGKLDEMNSNGDRERGRFARQLDALNEGT